jgi:hypothetical protein
MALVGNVNIIIIFFSRYSHSIIITLCSPVKVLRIIRRRGQRRNGKKEKNK